MTRGMVWRFASLMILLCYWLVTVDVVAEEVDPPEAISRDGTVNLSWQSDYADYEQLLVRKASGGVIAAYPVIANQNWSLSGLSNGNYVLSLSDETRQKKILVLRVQHYSLNSALSLFGLGLLLFAYLVFTLRRGEADND